MEQTKKRKFKIPHVYVIILCILFFVTVLTYIVPAGTYDFVDVDGKSLADPESFHYIEQTPVSFWDMMQSIPEGMVKQASLIFSTFLVTGGIGIINRTKALEATVGRLAIRVKGKLHIAIPLFMLPFVLIGAKGIATQIVAFIPLGLLISFSMGGDAIAGIAMVILGMSAGFCVAPFGTSSTGTAQTIVGLPLFSGWEYRVVCAVILWLVTAAFIYRYFRKIQTDPTKSLVYNDPDVVTSMGDAQLPEMTTRHVLVAIVFLIGILAMIAKVIWGTVSISDVAVIFILTGVIGGFIFGYGPSEIAKAFVEGCKSITFGALLIGLGASIGIVLTKGNVIYTCVHALCKLLGDLPVAISAVIMNFINIFINFFIVSASGQASTVMPIMSPTATMLGITQQTAVLAFQLGDGFTNMILPQNGTLMACLAIGSVAWQKWAKFVWKLILIQTILGFVFVAVAATIGWGAIFG